MTATEENIGDTADLVGEYADALLPALKIVEKAAKRPLRLRWREGLTARIEIAIMAYDGTKFIADYASKITVHDIDAPLAEVIEVLEDDEVDGHAVLVALGAPQHMMASPDRESLDRALAEREILLHLLRKLADNLPPAPAKRRGRPKANDLHQLVGGLANVWEDFTGQEFTQLWHKEKGKWKPISAAAQFAHAVITVVDPKRLPSVPEVTEQIVKRRRRKATSDK
jgi:hypothetical protein